MKNKSITYAQVGDNYDTKDPVKKLAQTAARETGKNLKEHGFAEVAESRGESAYVWKQGDVHMASVIEGLGTKNLVADAMRKITGKTYYDVIGHDTVATIINDLVSVGADPLVVHAYWAVEDNSWLQDEQRMKDLIDGWKSACDLSEASWGGGETPTMKGIMKPDTCELGGSAIGIIKNPKHLLTDTKLQAGDRILFLKSTGINANGLSLARAVAEQLPDGYATKMPASQRGEDNGQMYGEAILQKTNIYAKVIHNLLALGIDIHYISNITGHGVRKIMRARENWTYIIEKIFTPTPLFPFIQKHANLDQYEMYQTYNMGQDYAVFIPEKDVEKAQQIIQDAGFESLDAGHIEKGEKQVIIKPENLTYKAETLDLR